MASQISEVDKSWLDSLIEEIKRIRLEWVKDTFIRYRKCGQLILSSGYRKGRWHDEHRQYFLSELKMSQKTFSRMIQLGEMGEDEFSHAMTKFSSVYAWANPKMFENKQEKKPQQTGTPPFPQKRYRCLVIDPPWPIKKIEREERPNQGVELDYPTMTLEEIEKVPVSDLADPEGCHVYLWVTHKFLPEGLRLFEKWCVKYQCVLTWVKPTGMTPFSWMYNTEHVLFGRIGDLDLLKNGVKLSFEAPVTRHSEKPEIFYETVKQVSPDPRIDLFARKKHEGFDVWGNEVADR